ncbi:hypothetical protein SDJN02_24339, partial [Cucurbita argyrosperma subsp. argyrosperma]
MPPILLERTLMPPQELSPTTPLTWSSGGGGGGGGGGGMALPLLSGGFVDASDAARSKIGCKSEVVGTIRGQEEHKLALATLRVTVEKQRDINGSLKKMK